MIKEYIKYLKDNPQGYWFKRKLYGWGWTPATWQGWATIGVYIVLILLFALTVDENSPKNEVFFTFFLPIILLTVTLIRICYTKGESPRWQWGISDTQYDGTIGKNNKIALILLSGAVLVFGLVAYWIQTL